MTPRIGITTSYEDGRQMLDRQYVTAIEAAGGLPMIVPMLQTAEAMSAFTQMLDGLMIPGGPGIVRGLVGELPEDLEPVDPLRDRVDSLAFQAMADRPVLGICYGMQFINAQAGGTLYGDLMKELDSTLAHSPARGGKDHLVTFKNDSLLYALFGDVMHVNTYHKQALASVGEGLKPVAYGPDGVIEAIESHDGRLIGVQFHPERMLDRTLPLFQAFVERCRKR